MCELEDAASEWQWERVETLLTAPSSEKPSADSLGYTLVEAAKSGTWKVVSLILAVDGDNQAPTAKVKKTLQIAVRDKQWDIVATILKLNGANKLSREFVEITLQEAIRAEHWETVQLILAMDGDNKSSAYRIEITLRKVLELRQWGLVQAILNITGDNRCQEELVNECVLLAIKEGYTLDLSAQITLNTLEIGNRLGLSGEPFEGFYGPLALYSCHTRFKQCATELIGEPSSVPLLHLTWIDEAIKENIFSEFGSQTEVNCHSISCNWMSHLFTVTLFKEGDNIHLIYINRGERAEERAGLTDENVMVYTLKNDGDGQELLTSLGEQLATHNRQTISNFLNLEEVKAKKNSKLTAAFAKSVQKVGNCGLANSNMAWHFALADQYMKEDSSSTLEDAFAATKPLYKVMRRLDRIAAFHQLLLLPNVSERTEGVLQFFSKEKFTQLDYLIGYLIDIINSLSLEGVAVLKDIKIDDVNIWILIVVSTLEAQVDNWDLIKKIITLMEPDESEIEYIKWVLAAAVKEKAWDIVAVIMNMDGEHKLEIAEIQEALEYELGHDEACSVLDAIRRDGDISASRATMAHFKTSLGEGKNEAPVIQPVIST